MRRKGIAIGLAVVAGLVLFMVPVFPYHSPGYAVAGGTWNQWESHVSASYSLFGCGLLVNTTLTETMVGNGSWLFSEPMPSPMLTCFYHPSQVLGPPHE